MKSILFQYGVDDDLRLSASPSSQTISVTNAWGPKEFASFSNWLSRLHHYIIPQSTAFNAGCGSGTL